MNIIKGYQRLLSKYPMGVQAVQAGTLMALGDHIAQRAVEGRTLKNLDLVRTTQFAGIGLIITGPATVTWYRILNRYIGSKGGSVVIKKVACDQLFFAPSFLIILLSGIHTLQGKTLEEYKTKIREEYFSILQNNYKLWPFVQLGNFYFTPLQYQALVVQVVALLWNIYITHTTSL